MKILFLDGSAGYYPGRIDKESCGGIITSLHHIPQYLAASGHDVSLISVHEKEEEIRGVKHLSKAYDIKPDVVIFNRNLFNNDLVDRYKDAYKIVWLHDIVEPKYYPDNAYTRMEKFIALSRYCAETYADFYDIPLNKFIVIPNGVDKATFYPGNYDERDQKLFIQASAPIKGLYPLHYTFINLKRNVPDVRLVMYGDQSMHGLPNTKTMQGQLDELKELGAEIVGPVPQKELAEQFRKAYALLMPNSYPEICSNILLQAKSCGLPVIASNIGSASEFIHDGIDGLLTHWRPEDMWAWQKDFAAQAVGLATSPELHRRISASAPFGIDSWSDIGAQWHNMLNRVVAPVGAI